MPGRRRLSAGLVLACALLACGLQAWPAMAADPKAARGEADVVVTAPTRLDWVFTVSNQSPAEPPAGWLPGYDSTEQSYELHAPANAPRAREHGLMLFVPAGDRAAGFEAVREACDGRNLLFASPHGAGNGVDTRTRVRIILDVLDDVRRKHRVDPDRTYIAGFSGGGRIALAIAFALPECFGGAMPICAAGELREEPWMRHRVIDRLSVAHLTGVSDFNRGEIERFRGPMLADVGVRSRIWVAEGTGHALPPPRIITEAVAWLDDGLAARRGLARSYPTTREPETPSSRGDRAAALVAEARARLASRRPKQPHAALMLLKGVSERWPDVPAAREARAVLVEAEAGRDRGWEEDDIAEQRLFLAARARGLSAYALGPLPPQYAAQRSEMTAAAVGLWTLLVEDGGDEALVREGKGRIAELQRGSRGDD